MRKVRHLTPVSEEEFLAFEATSPAKHEYVGGEVYAMVGVTKAHGRLVMNIATALKQRLRSPCEPFASDLMVRVEAAKAFYYPDVVVTCDPGDDDPRVVRTPSLVAEVLSESTADFDRRTKRMHYSTMPSVRYILLVDSQARLVELDRRSDQGWVRETVTDQGVLDLADLGVSLSLDDIYGPPGP